MRRAQKREPYAPNTTISVEKTEVDIKAIIRKFGGENIMTANLTRENLFQVSFEHSGYRAVISLDLTDNPQRAKARMRALLAHIKSKLVSVEVGLQTFEEEFLPNIKAGHGLIGDDIVPRLRAWKDGGGGSDFNPNLALPSPSASGSSTILLGDESK